MTDNHFDVIIIGTGAGGGTLLHKLAPTGKKILILERGGFLPREKDNWDSEAVVVNGKYHTDEKWKDKNGDTLKPQTHYYVGGNTKAFGAALFRLRKEDFGEIKHFDGISPAWAFDYEELESYYTAAEKLYQVRGKRGEDPTEPKSNSEYPYPPISHEPRIKQLVEDFKAQGVNAFHTPLGIRLAEGNPESKCIRCNTCDGFPCMVNGKSDAHRMVVNPSLKYPNVKLLINAYVEKLETDESGRKITSVNVERNGVKEQYSAEVVAVSCGAINSAALLLRSANEKHPNGLANSSDVVGRHYMGHVNSVLMAISRCKNPTVYQKTMSINDYYLATDEWEFPMGHISFVGKLDGTMLSTNAPALVPGFTLDMMADHSLDFWLTTEDLPDPNNRVTLDEDGGIILTYEQNNIEPHDRLREKLKSLLNNQTNCEVHEDSCHVGSFYAALLCEKQDSACRSRTSKRDDSFW